MISASRQVDKREGSITVLSLEFCEQRAEEAASAAALAQLDNIRDRELRSEAAWRLLASQAKAVRDGRSEREQVRELVESEA
jgi:hypothetical protein